MNAVNPVIHESTGEPRGCGQLGSTGSSVNEQSAPIS
jgi:hypothetical protein